MSKNKPLLQEQLNQALIAIDRVLDTPVESNIHNGEKLIGSFAGENHSLLERCEDVCKIHKKTKPTLRIIHHLACSGGSLISKCLSAMPNVFLLSEVHPYTSLHLGKGKSRYLPSDISSLAKYSKIPFHKKLAKKIFLNSIISTHEHVAKLGGSLILRDHSHSDYCVGEYRNDNQSSVVEVLSENFHINSLFTLRNPIYAYSSLVANKWRHFTPFNFDEYCKRVCQFIDQHSKKNMFFYEDFTSEPESVMKNMCNILELNYDSAFNEIFSMFNVTGDSGMSRNVIFKSEKKSYSDKFLTEVENSNYYKLYLTKIKFN